MKYDLDRLGNKFYPLAIKNVYLQINKLLGISRSIHNELFEDEE